MTTPANLVPVGTITRLGRRADGDRWHYGTFNEADLDLPPGTILYAEVKPETKPVVRPPNCGTGHCSCITCLMTDEQPEDQEP